MLNLTANNQRNVFFTSDWHYNHNKEFVYGARGYKSVKEHNQHIIDCTNERVKENDILFNLGDITLNSTIQDFEYLIDNIKCKNIYMLFGNHPNPHYKQIYQPLVKSIFLDAGLTYTDDAEVYPIRYKNVVYIGHYKEVVINGIVCVLSHYPISIWNEMSRGCWHLTGHSHYGFEPSTAENKNAKILDVGWDGLNAPWSFDEVRDVMLTKGIVKVDHH